MKQFNIDCDNINIGGSIFCSSDVTFMYDGIIDESYDTLKCDFHLNGDLYVVCNHLYYIGYDNNIIEPKLLKSYNKNDFRLITADKVYIKCPNLKVGKNIHAYYDKFDELRFLKLNKIIYNIKK